MKTFDEALDSFSSNVTNIEKVHSQWIDLMREIQESNRSRELIIELIITKDPAIARQISIDLCESVITGNSNSVGRRFLELILQAFTCGVVLGIQMEKEEE